MHEGVHALIKKDQRYLLVERRFYPYGFSLVAGHVDQGENPEQALIREISEELGAKAYNLQNLFDMQQGRVCPMFWYRHLNHIYSCGIDQEPVLNFESKSFGWFTPEQIHTLNLTVFARQVFERLQI